VFDRLFIFCIEGSADINAVFYGKVGRAAAADCEETSEAIQTRKHILQVSTYQMVLLMLFSNKEKWTFEVTDKKHRHGFVSLYFIKSKLKGNETRN